MLAQASQAGAQEEPLPPPNQAALGYTLVQFDKDLDPWHLVTAELQRRTRFGPVLARATVARRFAQTGEQLELEAYPRLTPRTYAFLNVGYSRSGLFPEYRAGAELFANTHSGLEFSLGARHLAFETVGVTLYTGSAGVYRGNYFLALRPFLSMQDDELLTAGDLLARRYLRSAGEYVTLRMGAGDTRDDGLIQFDLERISSFHIGLDGRLPLNPRVALRLGTGYEREDLPRSRERRRLTLAIGLDAGF
jgi:YaiO family outer membrane protein